MKIVDYEAHNSSDMVQKTCTIDDAEINPVPFSMDGITFIPAQEVQAGTQQHDGDMSHVQLMLSVGAAGLYHSMTPDGARALAAALCRAANEADASLAKQASAAINKARGQ